MGNPMFRSVGNAPFWPRRGNTTFDDDSGSTDAPAAGVRASERSGRASTAAASAPGGADGSARTAGGGGGVDASERGGGGGGATGGASGGGSGGTAGSGGGGGGGGASEQGQILFYHKPTLANVPAGDIPDVVPVYLGCPRGSMALGLPLNEAWQGGDHQDTTFNQNLAYTILSWPEDHIKDLLELWRLQVMFLTTMIFNVVVAALLFFADNPDRSRVEGPARAGAYPGPFEQRSPLDEPTGLRSEEWHLAAVLLIGLLGIVCVLARIPAGIALYLVLAIVNAIIGLCHSPDPLFACRYAVDVVLVVIGRSYLSSLTHSWVTASAGDGRRGW